MIAWRDATGDDRTLVAVLAASVGVGAALAVAAAPLAPALAGLLPACTFHVLTGLPCPACGSTRAALALLTGDVGSAFALNPLFTLAVASAGAFALLAPLWVAAGGRVPGFVGAPIGGMPRAFRVAACAAIGAQWAWLVVRGA